MAWGRLGVLSALAVSAAAAAQSGYSPPRTSWGDPDLEGIWTYDHQIPLQRPEKYAAKEFFTDA